MLRCAKELGIETFAVDADPHAAGFALADAFAVVSNRDPDAILRALEKTDTLIHGVSTMGSDIPHIVAAVANDLGLPSISQSAAETTVNKFSMKECFRKANILIPDYCLVRSVSDLAEAFRKWGRIVVKPLDQAGSKGVSLISDEAQLELGYRQAESFSKDGIVLAERYVVGDQISSESLIVDGQVHTPGLADRNYENLEKFLPQILENGGWVPSKYQSSIDEINCLIGACAQALGIENGVIKGDLVRDEEGRFAVIEVAARLSGGDFSESLVPLGSGVNYVKQVIRHAVGLGVDLAALTPTSSSHVANRYFFPPAGRLERIEGIDEIKSKPWIRKFEIWYEPDDIIPEIAGHGQRGGVFIIQGKEKQELSRYIAEVYRTVEFVMHSPSDSGIPGIDRPS